MRKVTIHTVLTVAIVLCAFSIKIQAQNSTDETQNLNEEQQAIVLISAYTATGDLENLNDALKEGLEADLTVNEIKEVIVHLYAYVGFPRSIRGLNTFMDVLDQREAKGIEDELGPEASPINDERNKYERGVETLYELTGREWGHPESGYGAFAPVIDRFLKEHLFTDLFERDVLTYLERELVTISALSSIRGVEPMLGSHMRIGMNLGLSESQLEQLFSIIEGNIGEAEAKVGRAILIQMNN
jgi:alkylhydroperoxidase/carboxymuconolactone decarboxylase family protein YurZ